MTVTIEESRRLTGANIYFDGTGAALEAVGADIPESVVADWAGLVRIARSRLHWPDGAIVTRRHASGVSLAFEAPLDQLITATEVNEWALTRAAQNRAAADLPDDIIDMADREADVRLVELVGVATSQGLPVHFDDEFFTAGEGHLSQQWPAHQLPTVAVMNAAQTGRVPKVVITGSNGKTTTTRALAAILSMTGKRTGYSSTDGIVVDGDVVEDGDFSGPMGLRSVLRNPSVEVAILETARGGLLRRGLATQDADVAVVTNVSADHFGEYGVHALEHLLEVKLLVHKSLRPDGTLVVNAGDEFLASRAAEIPGQNLAWFARSLSTARERGLPACGVQDGRMIIATVDGDIDLGETVAMPIGLQNKAPYNLENLAAAALSAHLLGVDAAGISAGLLSFGRNKNDNLGRLQYWTINGAHVLLDYAHNPDGMQSLLNVASQFRGDGRMGLVLEQAGNRTDEDIAALAVAAAVAKPDHVWLKDIGSTYLRGRAEGEVIGILRQALLDAGMEHSQMTVVTDIEELMSSALAWAGEGDVLVLPVHQPEDREVAIAMLDGLAA